MGQQNLQPDNEERLVTLGRTLQALREEENADVLIETALDYLKNEFKYRLIWIGLYDRLDHRLVGKGGITPTGDTRFLKQPFNLYPGDLLEQVVIQQRPVGIPDLRQEIRAGEWCRAAQEFGIQGTLILPLRYKDRSFGVALLGSPLWGVSPRPAQKAQLSLLLGGLAAALYQIEVQWQRSAIKRPDQPLFQLLNQLMQVPTLTLRLEAVVTMTQEFVAPTRTNIYWYSPQRRYFWHRLGNHQSIRRYGQSRSNVPGLTVAEVNDFYQALAAGRLISIGAARSLLSSESTKRLLERLQSRSLLAAPIQANGELLGFLAVEDNEARIWEEAERNYVNATAQLVGLVASQEVLETTLEETQKDARFAAEIARAIVQHCPANPVMLPLLPPTASEETQAALFECGDILCQRLEANLFLVLQEDDNGQFSFVCQPPLKRRPFPTLLTTLAPHDRQLLLTSTETVMIEDLDEDLRLVAWRQTLAQMGVRSLLIAKTANPDASGKLSLLLVGHSTPRTWSNRARDLVNIVAQQINQLLQVERYSDTVKQVQQRHQTLQDGLSTLSGAPLDPVLFERTWVEYLAERLQCPLTALFSWAPESNYATVVAAVVTAPHFALSPNLAIVINNELIQDALASQSWLCRSAADLPEPLNQWLCRLGLSQLLIIALHTPGMPTTSFILLADEAKRQLPHHLLMPLATLNQQFAWFRQYRYSLSRHAQENETLQTLNWYKHQCLESLHQSVSQSLSALFDFQALRPNSSEQMNRKLSQITPTDDQRLLQMRRKQLLQQLEETLTILTPVLEDEQWQLKTNLSLIPLAGLLKRSLRRVEPLFDRQHLRIQVHNSSDKNVYGDSLKLECVLFELLITVCVHAQPRSRINLWCCPFSLRATPNTNTSTTYLELLIAENGSLEECLQTLTSASPQSGLSTNLTVCQHTIRSWGGDLQFFQPEADAKAVLPRVERNLFQLRLPQ